MGRINHVRKISALLNKKARSRKFTATGHVPTRGNGTLTPTKGGIGTGNDPATPICHLYDTPANPLSIESMFQPIRKITGTYFVRSIKTRPIAGFTVKKDRKST